jgi:hypothetical protein
MNGGTSLRLAQLLFEDGVRAVSLIGGLLTLASAGDKESSEMIELARE